MCLPSTSIRPILLKEAHIGFCRSSRWPLPLSHWWAQRRTSQQLLKTHTKKLFCTGILHLTNLNHCITSYFTNKTNSWALAIIFWRIKQQGRVLDRFHHQISLDNESTDMSPSSSEQRTVSLNILDQLHWEITILCWTFKSLPFFFTLTHLTLMSLQTYIMIFLL